MAKKSLVVKSRFTADDEVSRTARNIENNTRRMSRNMSRGFRDASKSALNYKAVLKGILAASVIQKSLGLMDRGIRSAVTEYLSFDDAITQAASNFKDLDRNSVNFQDQLKNIGKVARQVAASTRKTPAEMAKGMLFLAKAGFTTEEAFRSLESMVYLSTSTGEDFATVSDWSSDLLGAFGLAVNDSAQKIKNLWRMNDVLAHTATTANVKVEDMFETFKVAAPIADEFGSTLEEMAAIVAVMGASGIKGSMGATTLKNTFTRLADPTTDVAEGFRQLQIAQKDLIDQTTGKFKKPIEIFRMVGKGMEGLAQPERLKVLSKIFGKFALAGGAKLAKNITDVDVFFESIKKKAPGAAKEIAKIQEGSMAGRLDILESTGLEKFMQVIDPFTDRLKESITDITEWIKKVDVKPFVNGIEKGIEAVKLFIPLIKDIKDTGNEIAKIFPKIEFSGSFVQTLRDLVTVLRLMIKGINMGVQAGIWNIQKIQEYTKKPSRFDERTERARKAGGVAGFGLSVWKGIVDIPKTLINDISWIIDKERALAEKISAPFERSRPEYNGPIRPEMNVSIENNINAEGVTVNSTVKAPGTRGTAGENRH